MSEKKKLIEEARSSLSDTKMVKEDSDRLFWNSVYYCLFYAAKAALKNYSVEPGSHSGTDSQLGKTFYKEESLLDAEEASFYSDIRRIREESDYDLYASITRDKDETLDKAENLMERLIEISKN